MTFDPETFAAGPIDPLERVPGLADATALWEIAEPLFVGGRDASSAFDKPSNPVFQPDEYRSTNCCLPCFVSGWCDCSAPSFFAPALPELIEWLCGCLGIQSGGGGEEEAEEEEEEDEEEKEPTCLPCRPPVGTTMYQVHSRHIRVPGTLGGNHGVPGDRHVHHWIVGQRPATIAAEPCKCHRNENGKASGAIRSGEIPYQIPTGGGLDGC